MSDDVPRFGNSFPLNSFELSSIYEVGCYEVKDELEEKIDDNDEIRSKCKAKTEIETLHCVCVKFRIWKSDTKNSVYDLGGVLFTMPSTSLWKCPTQVLGQENHGTRFCLGCLWCDNYLLVQNDEKLGIGENKALLLEGFDGISMSMVTDCNFARLIWHSWAFVYLFSSGDFSIDDDACIVLDEMHNNYRELFKESNGFIALTSSWDYAASTFYLETGIAATILIIVSTSCSLDMLYNMMNYWVVEDLVVIFCNDGTKDILLHKGLDEVHESVNPYTQSQIKWSGYLMIVNLAIPRCLCLYVQEVLIVALIVGVLGLWNDLHNELVVVHFFTCALARWAMPSKLNISHTQGREAIMCALMALKRFVTTHANLVAQLLYPNVFE
ncbi:Protein SERAC1 [Senna tora]|uniref:Protein SERAC1 n=1 Tax=Senna tora TaxID=362788 RepID=A0A835CJ08_9FABA|nr:Protein SERAC1 [Senna tora]